MEGDDNKIEICRPLCRSEWVNKQNILVLRSQQPNCFSCGEIKVLHATK